jgi:hypothetical protein
MHDKSKDLIQIQDTPDIKGKYCTINLNITWDTAEKIASVAAPILQAIGDSVDTRTAKQIHRENQALQISVNQRKRRRILLKHVFNNLKKIHYEGLSYQEFCKAFEADTVGFYALDFSNTQRRKIYKRFRSWSIQFMYKQGLNATDISEKLNINKSQIYNYKNLDRRSIKYSTDSAFQHKSLSHHTSTLHENHLRHPQE